MTDGSLVWDVVLLDILTRLKSSSKLCFNVVKVTVHMWFIRYNDVSIILY